jgi:hypothetical protein
MTWQVGEPPVRGRLGLEYVERRSGDMPALDGIGESRFVEELTARSVHNRTPDLHRPNRSALNR